MHWFLLHFHKKQKKNNSRNKRTNEYIVMPSTDWTIERVLNRLIWFSFFLDEDKTASDKAGERTWYFNRSGRLIQLSAFLILLCISKEQNLSLETFYRLCWASSYLCSLLGWQRATIRTFLWKPNGKNKSKKCDSQARC